MRPGIKLLTLSLFQAILGIVMVTYSIITFRETLEVGLIIALIWGILKQTGQHNLLKWVISGLLAGLASSGIAAIVLTRVLGGFSGSLEKAFEGVFMLIGTALLTWLIIWLINHKHQLNQLKHHVHHAVSIQNHWALFFIVYTAVIREGIETILFLQAAFYITQSTVLWGACLGIGTAIIVCYSMTKGLVRVSLNTFFIISNGLLIAVAAGLAAHGIHELQSAGWLPIMTGELWNINPGILSDGHYALWHEKGTIGRLLKGLFGYNGNPSGLEFSTYGLYLISLLGYWRFKIKTAPQIK